MPQIHTPKYRRQTKDYGELAFVELDGVRHYLGKYDSPESHEKYHRLLAEWTSGCKIDTHTAVSPAPSAYTIVELCSQFWNHAQQYYQKPDGTATSELDNFKQVIRPLKELYATLPVADFGPKAFKAVREKMLARDLCRNQVNKQSSRVKFIFKWGVEQELVPASVWHSLQAVSGLRRGRSSARESEPVRPAPIAHVNAVQQFVSRQVWAVIQLQILTAARAGELLMMRATDIDAGGDVWIYKPTEHKTSHHGYAREIYLGPQAQQIVREFMAAQPLGAYLFSAQEAEQERNAKAEVHRRPGQKPNERKTKRKLGEHYTTASYRRAIARACKKAGVPEWHPHQLRHNAATELRRQFGVDAARVILGHRSPAVTEIYAELDRDKAVGIIAKIG